jgi:hypothetical protein
VTIPFLENAAAMCSNPFGPWTRRELLMTVPSAVLVLFVLQHAQRRIWGYF